MRTERGIPLIPTFEMYTCAIVRLFKENKTQRRIQNIYICFAIFLVIVYDECACVRFFLLILWFYIPNATQLFATYDLYYFFALLVLLLAWPLMLSLQLPLYTDILVTKMKRYTQRNTERGELNKPNR